LYEVLTRQDWARVKDVTAMLTMASGIAAPADNRSANGREPTSGTTQRSPHTIVKLYLGPIKVLTNTSATFNGVLEGRDKNQVAGLELTETFLLCGRAAHNIFHPLSQIQVASEKFGTATTEAGITMLELELSKNREEVKNVFSGALQDWMWRKVCSKNKHFWLF
jgi:hypothetical protein